MESSTHRVTVAPCDQAAHNLDPVAQNIYDDESFFRAYAELPRSMTGLDAAPEWPALRAMLGALTGARCVDLGCGYGWFARWAVAAGAEYVLGLDLSEKMLARAASTTDDTRISYRRADLDELELPEHSFDIAYSSLTLHYVGDLARLLSTVHRSLVPGGRFVFSIEHPVFTAPRRAAFTSIDGMRVWPLDGYFDEGPRITEWLAPGVVKQHRTLTSYLDALITNGFVIRSIVEWQPSGDDLVAHPEWAAERERPSFLLVAAERPAAQTPV